MALSISKLYRLQVPFKGGSYEHHSAKRSTTDSVIIEIRDEEGITGLGECCPRSYVTGESYESVLEAVNALAPSVLANFDGSMQHIVANLNLVPDSMPSVRCLFETALLTYLARKSNKDLFTLLGIKKEKNVQYTAAFDAGDEATFQKMGQFYAAMQMKCAKLKIHSDTNVNIERIRTIQTLLGETTAIRMDGNEIWNWHKNQTALEELVNAGITCIEQPFAKDDWASCANFRKHFRDRIELIADESVTTLESAVYHATHDYFTGVNLKISKNGGFFRCLEIAQLFHERGKTVRLGCHVGETSLLSLWGLLFAGAFDDLEDIEGAFGSYILSEDPFQPSILFGREGYLALNTDLKASISNFEFHHPR